jgi:hypothetical protein
MENINRDNKDNKNNIWVTQSGKKVRLVEPNDPWYINADIKAPVRKPIKKYVKLNQVKYRNNADYKSTFVMDTTRPDMGYGYNYASRLGQPCSCKKKSTEYFGKSTCPLASPNVINYIERIYLIVLLLFVISLLYFSVKQ